MTRIDIIRAALAAVDGHRYLEIGVKDGACFHAIDAPTRVAVDPRFGFRPPWRARLRALLRRASGTLYFSLTSDAFFAGPATRLAPFDVVFVDGLHTDEQVSRDILNAFDVLADGGVVLVHDCNPSSAAAAAPSLEQAAHATGFTGEWNGDVYRAIVRLRTRADLRVSVLDCDQGVAIVRRGRPVTRLDLSTAEVDRLGYEDLEQDRVRLLDLRSPPELAALLP